MSRGYRAKGKTGAMENWSHGKLEPWKTGVMVNGKWEMENGNGEMEKKEFELGSIGMLKSYTPL